MILRSAVEVVADAAGHGFGSEAGTVEAVVERQMRKGRAGHNDMLVGMGGDPMPMMGGQVRVRVETERQSMHSDLRW